MRFLTRRRSVLAFVATFVLVSLCVAGWQAQAGRWSFGKLAVATAAVTTKAFSRAATRPAPMPAPVFATRIVTKTADTNDGVCNADCSLREAIAAAAPGDTITFGVTGMITLGGTELVINKNLTIQGPGATVDGQREQCEPRLQYH